MNLSLFDMRIHLRALRSLCAAFALLATGTVAAQSVTVTAPANGASYTLGNTVNLTATKSGGNKVRFKQNGTVISTDNSPPFAASFTPGSTGSYALTAELLNFSDSVIATSATVNITVGSGGGGGGTVSATRRYVYDGYERLCKVIEPERGATIIDYDAADNIAWTAEGTNLTSTTDCQRDSVTAGQKVTRTYDAMNRVTAVATPGGTADVVTTYYADGAVNTLTAANPSGNTVTTTYTYNKRRLLTGESSAIAGPQAHAAISLGYGYNSNGHLASLSYPDGETVNYAPDALGRASQVITAGGTTYASGIGYHAGGAISKFAYGNGILHRMTQNARKLPSRSEDYYCAPSDPTYPACTGSITRTLDDSYTFDKNGNVTDIVDGAQAGKTTRGMAYDALDRLTAAVAPDPSMWGNATFAYDALDNLRSMDVGTNRQYRYNYDANNRLLNVKNPAGTTQFAFTYDDRGNTTAKGSQAFVFDYANRMNAVTGSQTYSYDGQGRRVLTLDNDGKKTYWIYSQSGQVLYTEEARRRQNLSYIYLGNTQVATRAWNWDTLESTIRYQHTDSLGSIVAETATDRSVVKRNTYEPYGGAWNSTIDGTGYTGHVMDQATGLTYMQQRYYDPQVGRFLSTDPMASDMNNAWNFNRYNYAGNNPYKFTDPDGRQQYGYGMRQPSDGIKGCVEMGTCDKTFERAERNYRESGALMLKIIAVNALAGGGAAVVTTTGATAAVATTARGAAAAVDAKTTTVGIAIFTKGSEALNVVTTRGAAAAQTLANKTNELGVKVLSNPTVQKVTNDMEKSITIFNDFMNGMLDQSSPAPPLSKAGIAGGLMGLAADVVIE